MDDDRAELTAMEREAHRIARELNPGDGVGEHYSYHRELSSRVYEKLCALRVLRAPHDQLYFWGRAYESAANTGD